MDNGVWGRALNVYGDLFNLFINMYFYKMGRRVDFHIAVYIDNDCTECTYADKGKKLRTNN